MCCIYNIELLVLGVLAVGLCLGYDSTGLATATHSFATATHVFAMASHLFATATQALYFQ